jgi:hypothetical protein
VTEEVEAEDGGGVGRLGRGRVRDVGWAGEALRLAMRDGELSWDDG